MAGGYFGVHGFGSGKLFIERQVSKVLKAQKMSRSNFERRKVALGLNPEVVIFCKSCQNPGI